MCTEQKGTRGGREGWERAGEGRGGEGRGGEEKEALIDGWNKVSLFQENFVPHSQVAQNEL